MDGNTRAETTTRPAKVGGKGKRGRLGIHLGHKCVCFNVGATPKVHLYRIRGRKIRRARVAGDVDVAAGIQRDSLPSIISITAKVRRKEQRPRRTPLSDKRVRT